MGVFDDKKFEQLDWMVQITETIDADVNGLLARLPDRVEFPYEEMAQYADSYSLSASSEVRNFLRQIPDVVTSYEEDEMLANCYKFELSEGAETDLESGVMTGTLTLVKQFQTFTDEQLQAVMGTRGIGHVRRASFGKDALPRVNEILDILGESSEAMSNKSSSKKMQQLKIRLSTIFKNNEWRIRDMKLADKIGYWITSYIETGNLAALTNLCKVKIMTHNNMPIYSIQEESI